MADRERGQAAYGMDIVPQVRRALEDLAEAAYREFAGRLLPGVDNLLGVRLGKLRKIARQIAQNDAGRYLEAAPSYYFEEDMLCGMTAGYAVMGIQERKCALQAFVPRIHNWSVCDSCCATYHFMKEDREEWWEFLLPYFEGEEEFPVRFALVCGIFYFIEADYIDAFLEELRRFRAEGYYARMAAAWAVSVCYVRFRDRTRAFLEENTLDADTHNTAIRKIRESRQVPEEDKKALLCMKRTAEESGGMGREL